MVDSLTEQKLRATCARTAVPIGVGYLSIYLGMLVDTYSLCIGRSMYPPSSWAALDFDRSTFENSKDLPS